MIVERVNTGRGSVTVRWAAVAASRPATWQFTGQVLGPGAWTRLRAEVSTMILRDEHGMTEPESMRATVAACVLWTNETGAGESEWNWNVSNLHCLSRDGSGAAPCVRFTSSPEVLQAFPDLVAGVRAFWARVARIDLAMRHLASGGNLDPFWGAWRRPSDAELRVLWSRVIDRLAEGRPDIRELSPNPYRDAGSGGGSGRGSSRRRRSLAGLVVLAGVLVLSAMGGGKAWETQ